MGTFATRPVAIQNSSPEPALVSLQLLVFVSTDLVVRNEIIIVTEECTAWEIFFLYVGKYKNFKSKTWTLDL